MSEKVRVLFKIPQSHPKWSKLARPVEIPLEEYVEFRMQERNGDKAYMAAYVTKRFLSGKSVSPDEIEMVTAVGNDMIIMHIDSMIDQGINPLEANENHASPIQKDYEDDDDEEEEDDDTYEGQSRQPQKQRRGQEKEESPKWDTNATIAVLVLVAFIAILVILIISFI